MEEEAKYTQVFITRTIYTDSTCKNLLIRINCKNSTCKNSTCKNHVDSDVSALKVSRAMNNKYLYLKPTSPSQFQCHTNMGPKECS